mgnify:FL=1
MRHPLVPVAMFCAMLAVMLASTAAQADTTLLMVGDEGCPYCRRFRAEILPGYAAHPQGRAAPLREVDIDGPYPNGLALDRRPQLTPTFILLDDGREVARIEGYPGKDAFWPMLGDMLDRPRP